VTPCYPRINAQTTARVQVRVLLAKGQLTLDGLRLRKCRVAESSLVMDRGVIVAAIRWLGEDLPSECAHGAHLGDVDAQASANPAAEIGSRCSAISGRHESGTADLDL